MKYPKLWYRDLTRQSRHQKETFLRSLSSIRITISNKYEPNCFGLILLDNVDTFEEALNLINGSSIEQTKTIVVLFDTTLYKTDIIWNFLFAGASKVFDFESTPFLHQVIEEHISRWHSIESLLKTDFVREYLVGESLIWKNTLREIIEVAVYTPSSVLIIGESGTGKEMLSKLIHHFDTRPNKADLVLVDCTTISPELSGSEFFGHEKGAFTGAINSRDGAFTLANQGTLFIDEIGELSLRLQAELLRVIQDGIYKPVGSNFWKKTYFRLVSATNRTLINEVSAGRFRLDLYYRLSSWVCKIPSLSERREDIPHLAQHFFSKFFGKKDIPKIDESVVEYLKNRTYQGNVRELQQLIQRIVNQHVGKSPITLGNIAIIDRPEHKQHLVFKQAFESDEKNGYEDAIQFILNQGLSLREIRDLTTQTAIDLTLRQEKGRVTQAANRLGITSRAIQLRKPKKLD